MWMVIGLLFSICVVMCFTMVLCIVMCYAITLEIDRWENKIK